MAFNGQQLAAPETSKVQILHLGTDEDPWQSQALSEMSSVRKYF